MATSKMCETAETKAGIIFLTDHFNSYGFTEKVKSDKGGHLCRPNTKNFVNPGI